MEGLRRSKPVVKCALQELKDTGAIQDCEKDSLDATSWRQDCRGQLWISTPNFLFKGRKHSYIKRWLAAQLSDVFLQLAGRM